MRTVFLLGGVTNIMNTEVLKTFKKFLLCARQCFKSHCVKAQKFCVYSFLLFLDVRQLELLGLIYGLLLSLF